MIISSTSGLSAAAVRGLLVFQFRGTALSNLGMKDIDVIACEHHV